MCVCVCTCIYVVLNYYTTCTETALKNVNVSVSRGVRYDDIIP